MKNLWEIGCIFKLYFEVYKAIFSFNNYEYVWENLEIYIKKYWIKYHILYI
jgi:hypothetical protein